MDARRGWQITVDRIGRLVGIDLDGAAGRENASLDEFIEADLSEPLPFEDASFDLVYSNFVVEHLDDPARTFREFHRVLRPDGWLVLLTSNRSNPFMAAARAMPQRLRVLVKRSGAGAVERDVFPARYRANTPAALGGGNPRRGLHRQLGRVCRNAPSLRRPGSRSCARAALGRTRASRAAQVHDRRRLPRDLATGTGGWSRSGASARSRRPCTACVRGGTSPPNRCCRNRSPAAHPAVAARARSSAS